jgi:hypothetical protein
VLLLPYVDIDEPPFVQHNFPEPDQYLARQNFLSAESLFGKLQLDKEKK